MKKYVAYTAIFGNYDVLKTPKIEKFDVDYICFTDNRRLKSKFWKIIYFDNSNFTASQKNRYLKILGPVNDLAEYDFSIYIDGSVVIKKNPKELFSKYSEHDFMNFKHPFRSCLYREIEQCLIEERGDRVGLFRQGLIYQKLGFPENYSLSENTVLYRNHRYNSLPNILNDWWKEVLEYSGRDQVCLPYVLWKNNVEYDFFNKTLLNSDYFEIGPHKKEYIRRLWRVYKNSFFNKFINLDKVSNRITKQQ